MPASRMSEKKSASRMPRTRCASGGISEAMNKFQTAKLSKIAEEYKLDARDVN